ncbi:MAG: PilZ domain-containing protein [Candidatus Acidiferrales bacterium]|jgi:hypothetical protein
MTERRLARRYDLSLPVNIRMPINREPRTHSGQTRDISTRGVYFTMTDDLAPGSELDFTLTLPAEITRGSEVFVRAHGRVIRIDKHSDDNHESVGVAAVIERYDIVRGEGSRT